MVLQNMLEKGAKEVSDQYASQMIHFKSLPVSSGEHGMETGRSMGWRQGGAWDGDREEHGMETGRSVGWRQALFPIPLFSLLLLSRAGVGCDDEADLARYRPPGEWGRGYLLGHLRQNVI